MGKEIMVKVCSKCGIVNTERARKCEECGTRLGAAVKNSKVEKMIDQITERNEKTRQAIESAKYGGSGEKVPYIPVTTSRIIIGVIASLIAAVTVVLLVLSFIFPDEHANDLITIDFCTLVLLAIAILYCFLPGEMWAFGHIMYQLHYKEMPEPSDTGLVFQQIGCVFLTLLGGASFAFHLAVILGVL